MAERQCMKFKVIDTTPTLAELDKAMSFLYPVTGIKIAPKPIHHLEGGAGVVEFASYEIAANVKDVYQRLRFGHRVFEFEMTNQTLNSVDGAQPRPPYFHLQEVFHAQISVIMQKINPIIGMVVHNVYERAVNPAEFQEENMKALKLGIYKLLFRYLPKMILIYEDILNDPWVGKTIEALLGMLGACLSGI